MISVTVEMVGIFRTYTTEQSTRISVSEGSTIIDLLVNFEKHCRVEFRSEVTQKISTSESLQKLVFINNQNLYYTRAFTKQLKDGDRIMFLPPMEGG